MRIDGKFHLSDGLQVRKLIKNAPYKVRSIFDVTSNIYCPGIFQRHYTSSGTPFLGGADIQKQSYDSGKYLKESTTPNHEILAIKKGWTLVTCGGTVGETAFANRELAKCWVSQHVMRLIPDGIKPGMLYSYLATNEGKMLLTTNTYGSVIPTLNSNSIGELPIPEFPGSFQQEVDDLIQESARLREEAADMLEKSKNLLKEKAGLDNLVSEDYDYYGHRSADRKVSCFSIKQKEITTTTINAFNYSRRILNTKSKIQSTVPLKEVLLYNDVFSTGSFPRVEVSGNNGIMLINQSDIFDAIIKGKRISKRRVKTDNLVEYGEVLIAGVGTLGDSEKFCHVIFANEDLVGQLVSGEFIRMKTTKEVTSGYLFAWLDTDYGFRLIRNTQAGTKLCRPIPRMLLEIPVPLIDSDSMQEIDRLVREAHTKRYQANCNERKAISMVEKEIESWTTSKKN